MLISSNPEQLLDRAVNALATGPRSRSMLDAIDVPIYTTDASGAVTYWNAACVEFAGREPELGRDRWCVTWKLYTTAGDPLSHDRCPMAQAIREKRAIREVIAIAERPDGSRVAFKPYPTPMFNKSGELIGAVNMLIDVTEEQGKALRQQAEHCRRLADATYDRNTRTVLVDMADGFERTAEELTLKRTAKAVSA
jgi:PAS domain S-box-containing protein